VSFHTDSVSGEDSLRIKCGILPASKPSRAGPNCREASNHVNRAVAELHRAAKWTLGEMERMARVQRGL
jgi:hypothetical protein